MYLCNVKEYYVRVYIESPRIGNFLNKLVRRGEVELVKSFDGVGGVLAVYDMKLDRGHLSELVLMGVRYFPLGGYGDFVIRCPHCGRRIDDDMILLVYNESLLGGNNINCCGVDSRAVVTWLGT